jgi:hypothetical protein
MGVLTIIDHAIEHTSKFKSSALDSGSPARSVIHLLQRTINRLHLQIEISDYQVAASLLQMPTTIMTDTFAYGSPLALSALRAKMSIENSNQCFHSFTRPSFDQYTTLPGTTMEEINGLTTDVFLEYNEGKSDSDTDEDSSLDGDMESFVNPFCPLQSHPTPTDILLGLGHISKLYIDLPNENNPEGTATFIPTSSLYLYRGSELHELNYYEYLGIVQFVNKPPRANINSPKKNCLNIFLCIQISSLF